MGIIRYSIILRRRGDGCPLGFFWMVLLALVPFHATTMTEAFSSSSFRPWRPTLLSKSKRSPVSLAAVSRTTTDEQTLLVAEQLLSLLVHTPQPLTPSETTQIQDCIEKLALDQKTAAMNVYNPTNSLFGDLWCTLYNYIPNNINNDKPLWERLSAWQPSNLKGQQYYVASNTSAQDNPVSGNVLNYSEIWGRFFYLMAQGTFVLAENKPTSKTTTTRNWFDSIWSSNQPPQPGDTLRSCPDDYHVTISQASIHLFGKCLKLNIQGSSVLRVLYADNKLRIFVSPQTSKSELLSKVNNGDTGGGGEVWEQSGLVVCQVRSDLVTKNGRPMDLTLARNA